MVLSWRCSGQRPPESGCLHSSARTGALCALTCTFAHSPWHQPVALSTWWGRFVLKHEASKAELQAFVFREAGIPESLTFMVTASAWQKSAT